MMKSADKCPSFTVISLSSVQADGKEIDPILLSIHRAEDFDTLFLCNTSMNQTVHQFDAPLSRDRRLSFPNAVIAWKQPEKRNICELDLRTGKRYAVKTDYVKATAEKATFWPGR